MYESKWAGIIYGRSYHLDFRLIAIPEDFTTDETNWALEYILPTTRAAGKLSHHPRWSLFRTEHYCIMGVTCMVRDLIDEHKQDGGDNLTKDSQGRPLYIFVGYGTKLNRRKYAINFPAYGGTNLDIFQPLYQYVQDQWRVKDSGLNRKKTILTDYEKLSFSRIKPHTDSDQNLAEKLNCQSKYPGKIFLWQDLGQWESKLWATAAICKKPTSLCLGSANKQHLLKSPFLNGTVANITEFTIQERLEQYKRRSQQNNSNNSKVKHKFLLPQFIESRVKKDIQSTLQQAGQAVNLGQELVQNIIKKNESIELEQVESKSTTKDTEETFGFKTKPSEQKPNSEPQDWF